MEELKKLLNKQRTRYMMRMAFIHDTLRWRIYLPYFTRELMRGRR